MATVILKCTERCNSNCVYCDAIRYVTGVTDMPLSTLETVFLRINDFLTNHPEETMTFTWHGGEPLLLGIDYFKKAAKFQEEHCAATSHRIIHCMQSNMTLLTDAFVPVLRRLGINSLGSSYDPEPNIRGFGPSVDSRAYAQAFLKATGILEKHGMGWGIIYVVTKRSLDDPIGVFNTLANLKPDGGFNINPVIISDEARRNLAITPEEYADFLGVVFEKWYPSRDRYSEVQPFNSFLSNFRDEGRSLCCVDCESCAKRHICIDPAGNVSQCGRTSELGIMRWGRIQDKSIDELFEHSQLNEMQHRCDTLRAGDCKGCDIFPICHGGCPVDSYVLHGTFNRKTDWCNWKRRFIYKYFEPITGLKAENLREYPQ